MISPIVEQLDNDALIVRTLLQIRLALFSSHAASARLFESPVVVTLDHRTQVKAIDDVLALLGVPPRLPLPNVM